MSAQIIDGKLLSQNSNSQLKIQMAQCHKLGINPALAVVLVGDDPASQVYVKHKVAACEQVGIISKAIRLGSNITQEQLIDTIIQLNHDPNIHGILVQLPLPKTIDTAAVIASISPLKDVDGFHPVNVGRLASGLSRAVIPCTPLGCLKLLESINYPIAGKNAVVVGASNIVGKPMAQLLLQKGATVTICHSKTVDLMSHTKQADILIVAVGKPHLITASHVKSGAIVIDVGINRLDSGKLIGDVDFESVKQVAGWITPVPGGVGPMTIAMLLQNTLNLATSQNGLGGV